MFRFDTHVHTSQVSPCGHVTAEETVRLYHEAGYAGLCITDHYAGYFFDALSELPWNEAVDRYLTGYRQAKETGDRLGMVILPGCELRLDGGCNEFLLFGFREALFYQYPHLNACSIGQLHELAVKENFLVFQAHPFRPGMVPQPPEYLDGVEGINGNPRHNSHNELAQAYAREHGLRISAGSDCHEIEDVGRSGIITEDRVRTLDELKTALMGKAELISVL